MSQTNALGRKQFGSGKLTGAHAIDCSMNGLNGEDSPGFQEASDEPYMPYFKDQLLGLRNISERLIYDPAATNKWISIIELLRLHLRVLFECIVFSIVLSVSTIKFTPVTVTESIHAVARSASVFLAVFLIVCFSGRYTSSFFGPFRTLANYFVFVISHWMEWPAVYPKYGKPLPMYVYVMEFLKVLLVCAMQFFGYLVGIAISSFLFKDSVTGSIISNDCTIDPVPACPPLITNPAGFGASAVTVGRIVGPVSEVTTDGALYLVLLVGTIVVYGAMTFGTRRFAWFYPGIGWNALIVAGCYGAVHLLFSSSVITVDFWYWLVTSCIFTSTYDNPGMYVGMALVGTFVVAIVDLFCIYNEKPNGEKSKDS